MDNDPIKRQMAVIAGLQKQVATMTHRINTLEEENKSLKFLVDNQRTKVVPKRHIRVRIRKNGQEWQRWGSIGDVVRKAQHLTCREIVNLTGFERCAVYSAARRLGIKLRSPHQKA
jgi:hypothetical protein